MIRDHISNLSRYRHIHPDMEQVMAFFEKAELPDGRYDISPTCYIMVSTFQTRADETLQYETHRNYADIQVLLQGEELQYFHDTETLRITQEYQPDIALYTADDKSYLERILLRKGDFVVYFPGEAHGPGYCTKEEQTARKAVVKLKF